MVTALQIRAAVRKKWIKQSMFQEVSINDPWWYANYWRNQIDTYRWGQDFADRAEAKPAATLDPEWSRQAPSFRTIDLLILDKHRTAVEIKVSRSDFKRETDAKRGPWLNVTHKFYYAAPVGLIGVDELPRACGLLEFDEGAWGDYDFQHGITVAKRAKIRDAEDLPEYVTKGLLARLSRHEYRQDTGNKAWRD